MSVHTPRQYLVQSPAAAASTASSASAFRGAHRDPLNGSGSGAGASFFGGYRDATAAARSPRRYAAATLAASGATRSPAPGRTATGELSTANKSGNKTVSPPRKTHADGRLATSAALARSDISSARLQQHGDSDSDSESQKVTTGTYLRPSSEKHPSRHLRALTANDDHQTDDAEEVEQARRRRRDRCVNLLAHEDVTAEVRNHFLDRLDEPWVLQLIEMHNAPMLPQRHWLEWLSIAVKEGPRYAFVVRRMQQRRFPLNREMLAAPVAMVGGSTRSSVKASGAVKKTPSS